MTDKQKPKRGRPRIHPPGYRASGPPPDTPLRLGEERRAWLKKTYGGYQAGIKQLIDAAMSHDTDR